MRNWVKAAVAGALSEATFEQVAILVLHAGYGLPVAAWSLNASAVFGWPLIVTQAASGALWGLAVWPLVRRAQAAGYYVGAAIVGALLPFAAALALIAVGPGSATHLLSVNRAENALALGASWGIGFAVWMSALRRLP